MPEKTEIAAFYKFIDLSGRDLFALRADLLAAMARCRIVGSVILASEGFNASLSGAEADIRGFKAVFEAFVGTSIEAKSSFCDRPPFRRAKVKIKREIVTFKAPVDVENGRDTFVEPEDWNAVISRPDVLVLDTRNDYEYQSGTFANAVNPGTEHFSDLPRFVEMEMDPSDQQAVAVFCTGGIRCEKFAPYLKEKGFKNVYQLSGGILKYLAMVPKDEQLWQGECFVFDERISLGPDLSPGDLPDHSYFKGKAKLSGPSTTVTNE